MYVRVDDDDDDGTSDLVTRFYIEISATAGLEFTSTQEYGEDSVGLLGASYRVSCTEDFYSPDCSVFCRVRDDAQDHYTCDGQGNRVCLSGFEDPASNCTEPCTPTEGCCELILLFQMFCMLSLPLFSYSSHRWLLQCEWHVHLQKWLLWRQLQHW